MTENPIIDKIRKLRAKAQDSGVTEEEALLYASKVAELLQQHGLSMMDVADPEREDKFESQGYVMMYSDPWRMALFRSIEKLYFCYSFREQHWHEGKYRWGRTIVGRPHNIVMLREMYEYLEKTTLRLAREYAEDNWDHENSKRAVQIGFERGCGTRLAHRVYEMYLAQAKPEKVAVGNNLPVLYSTELEAAENFAKENNSLKMSRGRGSSINIHGVAGRVAAEGVSLSTQVGERKKGNLLT